MVDNNYLNQYKNKKVLVLGHTGFKGSWITLWLLNLGAKVCGFSLGSQKNAHLFKKLDIQNEIIHCQGDIRDINALEKVFNEFQPEIVFHLAAQSLVRTSYEDPKLTFDTNIGGSINVLESVKNSSTVKSLIYITTDKVYKNKEMDYAYKETDELGGLDPYSASKSCAEILFQSYLFSFLGSRSSLGCSSVRSGNVLGGGDYSKDRLIPDCVMAIQNNNEIKLRYPKSTRPWQYVLEPLYGYLLLGIKQLLEPNKYSGCWNFGPNEESHTTVLELTEALVKKFGKGKITVDNSSNPHEAGKLMLDCQKSINELGWKPIWNFEKMVDELVFWYESSNGSNEREISMKQINEFTSMI